ncbi:MAG: hypothetical protein AAF675_14505 [Pseudomonadota bacterium]
MDAGTLLAIAKLGGFALIVRAWMIARRDAEESRRARAAREAEAELARKAPAPVEDYREAA